MADTTVRELNKAKITYRSQRSVEFDVFTENSPSATELAEFQEKAGYHPAGYGSPSIITSIKEEDGIWKTTFSCWGSCD